MSDYVLIITIVLISIIFATDLWVREDLNKFNFILAQLSSFYIFPAFLTYAMLLISENHKLKWSWLWFASLAIAFSLYVIVDFTFLTDYDQDQLAAQYSSPSLAYQLFYRGGNVFIFVGQLWFLQRLKDYRQKIADEYSFIETIRLKWLEIFIWVYIVNNLLVLFLSLAFSFWQIGSFQTLLLTVYSSIVISLFYLCYNGIQQYSLVEYERTIALSKGGEYIIDSKPKVDEDDALGKYQSSSLTDSDMEQLYLEIQSLFREKFLYKESELKVQDIAVALGVTTHKISQTLNMKAKKSFYDYVNDYRVLHLKELLLDPNQKRYTILALAMDSGFNSKASLNRVFKQHTGLSPKAFQLQQSVAD